MRSTVLARAASETDVLAIRYGPDPGRSWSGIRQLVAGSMEVVGEERVVAAFERHPGPAGLLFDHWQAASSGRSEEAVRGLGARIDSHLSHNWAVQRPAISGVARLLEDLLGEKDFLLVVPLVNHLDWESLAALKSLYRLPRGSWPRLLLGYDDGQDPAELDRRGIAWTVLPGYLREAVLSFLGRSGARYEGVPAEAAGVAAAGPPADLPSLVEGVEKEAAEILAGGGEPDGAACRVVVEAMETCFRRYAFTAALWLGTQLFRRTSGLDAELAARAHGVVALSAHNRQFRSGGNAALGRFIAEHLEAAWEVETRPEVRNALLYRLAVAYGRRLGQMEEAGRRARRAVSEAEALEGDGLLYQYAWAHNILAYVHVRTKDAEGARSAMRHAADAACRPVWEARRAAAAGSSLDGDLALTRSLAVNNLAAAEAMCGEYDRAAGTLETSCRLESVIDGSAKYWAQNLVRNLRLRHRPDRALNHARSGLEAAAEDREASLHLFFLLQAADLSFRTGEARAAAAHYLRADRLATRLKPLARDLPDLDFPTAAALEEAGCLDRAEAVLRTKLEAGDLPPELVAEVCSRLAVVAARSRAAESAETWAARASEAALEDAHRHCLVRAALRVGRAARLLGRTNDAVDLLRWGLELIASRTDPDSVAPEDELLLSVELRRCRALPVEHLERCFLLVPEALSSSAAWWVLPDLLAMALGHGEVLAVSRAAALQESLATLVTAAAARRDCRDLLAAVREQLPAWSPDRSGAPTPDRWASPVDLYPMSSTSSEGLD